MRKTYPKVADNTDDKYPPMITLAEGEWFPVPVDNVVMVYYVPNVYPTRKQLREFGLDPVDYSPLISYTFPGLFYIECKVVSK